MERIEIEYSEAVELFVNTTLPSIKVENEVPNINFIFDEEGLKIIKSVYEKPFKLKNVWTPNIEERHMEFLKPENNMDENSPTIKIKDGYMFFMYLVRITNNYIRLCREYGFNIPPRSTFMKISRRIFLRMGIEDFENVEEFLKKQLEFLLSREFDEYKNAEKIGEYKGYEIYIKSGLNNTWDETNRHIYFEIFNKEKCVQELARIDYEIRCEGHENVCYIYAVQNIHNRKRDKKFERCLYTLNKGIENPTVHPTQVFSVLLFLQELKKKGIMKIKVPTLQVLNYRYHEILSEREKERFRLKWHKDLLDTYNDWDEDIKKEYAYELEFYKNVVDNMDYISYLKTEKLFALIDRCVQHRELQALNDLDTADGNLIFKLKL